MISFEDFVQVLVENLVQPQVTEYDCSIVETEYGINDIRNAIAFGNIPFNNPLTKINPTNLSDSRPYIMCGFSIESCVISGDERPTKEPSNFYETMGYTLTNTKKILPIIEVT